MIIIFGLRRLRKGLGPVMLRCANCGASPLVLFRVSTWFALFFIPIIPISFKHFTACPNCRRIEDVSKEQVESARAQAEAMRPAGTDGATDAPSMPAPAVVAAPAPTLESTVSEWAAAEQPQAPAGAPMESDAGTVHAAPVAPPAYPQPAAPAGWFPDPGGAASLRYWDGGQWTEHTTPTPGAG